MADPYYESSERKTDVLNLEAKISTEQKARVAADTGHTDAIAQLNIDVPAEVKARTDEIACEMLIFFRKFRRGDTVFNEAQIRIVYIQNQILHSLQVAVQYKSLKLFYYEKHKYI